jgi:hypothetical protein
MTLQGKAHVGYKIAQAMARGAKSIDQGQRHSPISLWRKPRG